MQSLACEAADIFLIFRRKSSAGTCLCFFGKHRLLSVLSCRTARFDLTAKHGALMPVGKQRLGFMEQVLFRTVPWVPSCGLWGLDHLWHSARLCWSTPPKQLQLLNFGLICTRWQPNLWHDRLSAVLNHKREFSGLSCAECVQTLHLWACMNKVDWARGFLKFAGCVLCSSEACLTGGSVSFGLVSCWGLDSSRVTLPRSWQRRALRSQS